MSPYPPPEGIDDITFSTGLIPIFCIDLEVICISKDLGVLNPVCKGQTRMSCRSRDIDF
jgi:hypothetical protein